MKLTRSGKSFVIPPGLSLKPTARLSGTMNPTHSPYVDAPDDESTVGIDLEVRFDQVAGRYQVKRFEVSQVASGPELTPTLIRSISVQDMLRYAASNSVRYVDISLEPSVLRNFEPELFAWSKEPGRAGRAPMSDRVLRSVALVYRRAEVTGLNAAQAVAFSFELQPRTATNWIRRARERGMFEGS